jgi:GntR family transcriptional regulator
VETSLTVQERRREAATITAAAGVPLHRQLFLVLHDEIGRGALEPGVGLPTEQSLCDQFGVSRITVRRALADLADAGLIERRHGVGSFVLERPSIGQVKSAGSYLDRLRQVDFETDVEVVELGIRDVPGSVVDRLGPLERGLYVLRLRRERRTHEPLMVTEAWLPGDLVDVITEVALTRAPLHRLLAEAGVELERMDHELTAEIAGPRNAQLMSTAIGAPLIRVNRVAFANGSPHHSMAIVLSPSRSRVMLNQFAADVQAGTGLAIAHDVRRPGS